MFVDRNGNSVNLTLVADHDPTRYSSHNGVEEALQCLRVMKSKGLPGLRNEPVVDTAALIEQYRQAGFYSSGWRAIKSGDSITLMDNSDTIGVTAQPQEFGDRVYRFVAKVVFGSGFAGHLVYPGGDDVEELNVGTSYDWLFYLPSNGTSNQGSGDLDWEFMLNSSYANELRLKYTNHGANTFNVAWVAFSIQGFPRFKL